MPSFLHEASSVNPSEDKMDSVLQEPTPIGSPTSETVTVSVSTAFHPASHSDVYIPDLIIRSSDRVFFHVHRDHLIRASTNSFNYLVSTSDSASAPGSAPVVPLPETSDVINVVFHVIYKQSCSQYNPSLAVLIASIMTLKKYGISLGEHINPTAPLFPILLTQAPMHAIELYMVAAENDLRDLAVAVSPHLLSFHLPTVNDEMAARMGPIYLKKLFFLHINRTHILQELMLTPPVSHPPTFDCGIDQQQRTTRAWALSCASLAWDARPDLSPTRMQNVLGTMESQLTCELCRASVDARIQQLMSEWALAQEAHNVQYTEL
ncbi:unnamed protein product [Somion occarium]|uniref:BTB domain-containing protein n=1 Tax=Somion occarium TaxID=3059160 RepID=A0ABP1DL34_9APHY